MLPIATAAAQLPFLPSSVKTETLAIGDLRGSVPASTTSFVVATPPEAAVSTVTALTAAALAQLTATVASIHIICPRVFNRSPRSLRAA